MCDSGLYQLIIKLDSSTELTIGKLGSFFFPRGYYIYTGSALRNLSKRVQRHLRKNKKMFWHIDYFLSRARVIHVLTYPGMSEECKLNRQTKELLRCNEVVSGFGSTDCSCVSHLLYAQSLRILMT